MLRILRALALLGIVVCVPAAAGAAPWTTEGLDDYWITRWERTGGAPSELVVAMTQDRQGFLWLGSTGGLFRFDGFAFERWSDISPAVLAGTSVRTLFVDHDGALWVGFDEGGVSRIDGNDVRNYTRDSGLPGSSVRTFAQDSAGTIWVGSLGGLYSLSANKWTAHAAGKGLPAGPVLSAIYDATGSLFVSTPDAIFRRRAGNSTFEALASHPVGSGSVQALCRDAHGHIVTTDPVQGFRVIDAASEHSVPVTSGFGLRVWCAHNGTIWVGTRLKGLWRVATPPDAHAALTIRSGLLAQAALSVFEDRDQNLWVGTSSGVFRLTPRNVQTLPDAGVATAVAGDTAGRMWIGTADGLLRFERYGDGWRRAAAYLPGEQIRSVHADVNGDVWVASANGVTRLEGGRMPAVPGWGARFRQVTSITSNAAGTLWLYDERLGLHRLEKGQLESLALSPDLAGVGTTVLHADRRNRLWLVNERAVEIRGDDGEVRRYTTADGLDDAAYRSIYEDPSGVVWLGGTSGLSRLIDGRFESVAITGVGRTAWIKSIVEDGQGQLWLGMDRGGIRLSRATFQNAYRRSQRLLAGGYEIFDGLPGTIRATSDRVAARTPTGQLWLTTDEGIAVIDPNTSLPDLSPVAARITSVQADEAQVDARQEAQLPGGTRRMHVTWGAIDLSAPDRVRFRYRLDGHDREWIDAGTRRDVQYANLAPGSYVFRVAAAREGAAWDESSGSTWAFTVAPRFYQAFWFPFAVAALVAVTSWSVWHIRLVQARRRFAITLRERARVSREVHDTLLQSLVGVALQCQTMADATDVPAVREKLVRLRHRIDAHIGEARELIWHLRSPTLERNDFITALRRMADDMVEGTSVGVEFRICGRVRTCPPHVQRELLRIGQEAISNAVRHGRPTLVTIELHFEDATVRLCVSDDGRGFTPPQTLTAGEGHYGLAMMRERAEEIGGRFSVRSLPEHGASIEATAPLPAAGAA